jgi:cytochrome c biogenesis protein CcmG/thiol:disulfide interchange protein DsbE
VSRRLRLIGLVLAAAAALAAFVAFGLASSGSPTVAPALPRERLAGAPITLPGLVAGAHGRATLVLFWASWCGPCEREAPAVQRFSQSATGSGRIVGVDWSDGLAGASAFLRRYRWSFPNVRDSEGTVGSKYGLAVLPTTFVLDAHGRIVKLLRGPQDGASLTRALAVADG